MRENVPKMVSMPPKFLWAPFLPAIANMAIQMPFMFITMALFKVNPVIWLISFAVGHIFIIIFGAKEPHLSAMMKSKGPFLKPSQSIYKGKGYKLAP